MHVFMLSCIKHACFYPFSAYFSPHDIIAEKGPLTFTYNVFVDLPDLGNSLDNAVLVPGNGDLVLHEGERGDVDSCSCLFHDGFGHRAVGTLDERVVLFLHFQSLKS